MTGFSSMNGVGENFFEYRIVLVLEGLSVSLFMANHSWADLSILLSSVSSHLELLAIVNSVLSAKRCGLQSISRFSCVRNSGRSLM